MRERGVRWRVVLGVIGISLVCGGGAFGADGTYTNASASSDGYWDNPNNWEGGIIASGATCTASFNAVMSADRIVTQTSNTTSLTIGHLAFTDAGGSNRQWTLSSSSLTRYLTFDADGSGGGTSTIYVAAASKGNIGFFGGTSRLMKTGPGQIMLSNSNKLYAGTFTVANGTLYLNEVNAARSMPVYLDGGDNNIGLSFAGAGDGAQFVTGAIVVTNSGTGSVSFVYTASGSRDILSSGISLGKTATFNIAPGILELTATVSGAGGITKTGSGALYFTGTSATYAGVTTISQGSIRLISNTSATLLPSGGQVEMGDSNSGSSAPVIYLAGSSVRPNIKLHVTTNGASASLIAGINGQNAGSHVVSGTIQIDRPSFLLTCNSFATGLSISSVISGVGGLQVNNDTNRTVTLTGTNTYSGGTTVVKGVLKVTGSGKLGTGFVTVQAQQNTNAVLQLWGSSSVIDDSADVLLEATNGSYGRISITNGVNETVHGLSFGGIPQPKGTYGSTASSAVYKDDNFFDPMYSGVLTVLTSPYRGMLLLVK